MLELMPAFSKVRYLLKTPKIKSSKIGKKPKWLQNAPKVKITNNKTVPVDFILPTIVFYRNQFYIVQQFSCPPLLDTLKFEKDFFFRN